ncbi:hypothetical protein AYX14_00419 [Cryptococcus neoformans]|nr:hypothetical protein C362_00876 [Cryptococcus neoformans var. grubii Bt1]OWZ62144.1 hypothetical protein AYX15_05670 [Cryptococcus neoformans var. grubii]OXG21665.1 hypothetical protein C366_01348 [Cryptococcus neoformans var. grubii Tu401-1]OXG31678.1 hypothetical protein C367_01363 [Cryptococcus neoformans var. grubii Ze90-1]OXM80982.1 hypothetical protein C364_01354 [Cryptococcus neoformans var. grubii Bt63]
MDNTNDPTMGGLDALVAAASSVSAGKNRRQQPDNIAMDMIDPALHNESGDTSNPVETISSLLANPAIVSLIADYNAKKGHRQVSLYTQLLSGSSGGQPPATPVQQTRYGRISRPPLHAPGTPGRMSEQGGSDSQIQAIKDALENVSQQEGDGDVSYDSLVGAVVSSGPEGRFWRPGAEGSSATSWVGDAETLAQAADASHRAALNRAAAMGANVTGDTGEEQAKGNNRGATEMSTSTDEDGRVPDKDGNLPEWPLPPSGKGGRKNMPRDELLARRRARNRVAAQESRKKKKQFFGSLAERLQEKEAAYNELETHCRNLEREIELLRKTVTDANLPLPNFIPEVHIPAPVSGGETPAPNIETPAELAFSELFNIDDNDDNDADFVPPSSPKRDSDSEDSDDEVDEEQPRRKKTKRAQEQEQEPEPMAEDEDEDLFLPIVDVPVPPRDSEDHQKIVKQAMTELHVDTPEQLMNVVKKMVETAEYGGVTEEQVGMLSKLLALGQAQGVSVW